ncbi:MAG TPA: hypothetical protein VLK33_09540 [Terriglobales bacterium]|nr:hypothetical protein [Terriglobales bacterium]
MSCIRKVLGWCFFLLLLAVSAAYAQCEDRILLNDVLILVDENETSFVRHGVEDFASYLTEITGKKVFISSASAPQYQAQTVIAFGRKSAIAAGGEITFDSDLGREGFILRASQHDGRTIIAVAGSDPHGTNNGIATLMQMVRMDGPSAFLHGPLNVRSTPSVAVRGLQSGGWPIKYPSFLQLVTSPSKLSKSAKWLPGILRIFPASTK